jgi:hypothetical protein
VIHWSGGLHHAQFDITRICLGSGCFGGLGKFAGPFARDAACGVFEPTGVLVIVAVQALANLHNGEHAAHLDRAVLTVTRVFKPLFGEGDWVGCSEALPQKRAVFILWKRRAF